MRKTRKIYQTNSDEVMITDAKKEIFEKHAKTLIKMHVTVMVKLLDVRHVSHLRIKCVVPKK